MIARLEEKLTYLTKLDRRFRVFGSDRHRYVRRPPSSAEVAVFETQLGVRLPDEYRELLIEIGHTVGPYYGILSPHDVWLEYLDWRDIEEKEFVGAPSTRGFPFSAQDGMMCIERELTGERDSSRIRGSLTENGAIPICYQGCTYYSCLVIAGEQIGKVWDVDTGEYQWWPAGHPPATNQYKKATPLSIQRTTILSLYEWYEGWLDRSIHEVEQLYPWRVFISSLFGK